MAFNNTTYARERRAKDPAFRKRLVADVTRYQQKLRLSVLTFYSGGTPICACCGESHYEFLALDHINNNGAEERRKLGDQKAIFRHLVKEGFPSGYQVLCHNCNNAKKNFGVCPHQVEQHGR